MKKILSTYKDANTTSYMCSHTGIQLEAHKQGMHATPICLQQVHIILTWTPVDKTHKQDVIW